MKSDFARLLRDKRGSSFEGIALSVAIIAVAFVASADMLDYMLKKHHETEQVASTQLPGNLDTAPTGSLPKLITRSVLDPCTGQVK